MKSKQLGYQAMSLCVIGKEVMLAQKTSRGLEGKKKSKTKQKEALRDKVQVGRPRELGGRD